MKKNQRGDWKIGKKNGCPKAQYGANSFGGFPESSSGCVNTSNFEKALAFSPGQHVYGFSRKPCF